MLVSSELVPEQAEYRRDWSDERGLSAHAALLVVFRLPRHSFTLEPPPPAAAG
jgi:hypothetical protein